MPGSSVTMERRCPMSRLNNVDFPTFGRPTMAMRGSGAVMLYSRKRLRVSNCEFGIGARANRRFFQNSKFAIRNSEFVSLPFWKISHQMLWDLSCLGVVYTETTKQRIGDLDNPVIGRGPKLFTFSGHFSDLFFGFHSFAD
jgi:hypothetical protein